MPSDLPVEEGEAPLEAVDTMAAATKVTTTNPGEITKEVAGTKGDATVIVAPTVVEEAIVVDGGELTTETGSGASAAEKGKTIPKINQKKKVVEIGGTID